MNKLGVTIDLGRKEGAKQTLAEVVESKEVGLYLLDYNNYLCITPPNSEGDVAILIHQPSIPYIGPLAKSSYKDRESKVVKLPVGASMSITMNQKGFDMSWYKWKLWRLAYGHNACGGYITDGDGVWASLWGSRYYFLIS